MMLNLLQNQAIRESIRALGSHGSQTGTPNRKYNQVKIETVDTVTLQEVSASQCFNGCATE